MEIKFTVTRKRVAIVAMVALVLLGTFFLGATTTIPVAYNEGWNEGYVQALEDVEDRTGIVFEWHRLKDGRYEILVYYNGSLVARTSVQIHCWVQKNNEPLEHHDGTLTSIGKDFIEQQVSGSASTTNAIYISTSNNDSSPSVDWTQLPNEINANGFTRATGVYVSTGTGTWNVSYTFTASGTQSVQLYGLQWNATALSDDNLLCADTSSVKNCVSGDTLKVTWQCTVS